jgi:hypothetical protein
MLDILAINPEKYPELSLKDFSLDISQKFGYSREELDIEVCRNFLFFIFVTIP